MPRDSILDGILADIRDAMPEAGDSVTILVGAESCPALFDDGEIVDVDSSGRGIQTTETVVRYRTDAITRPLVGALLVVTWPASDHDAASYYVREVRSDPANPGMIRVLLARS